MSAEVKLRILNLNNYKPSQERCQVFSVGHRKDNKGILFAPVGLDEPYRVVISENPMVFFRLLPVTLSFST